MTKRTTTLLVLLAVGTGFLAGCLGGEAPQEAREGEEEAVRETPENNETVPFQMEDEAEIGNRTAHDAANPRH